MGVSINHLTIRIGGAPIVSDVHIDVCDGQRVGLIGASGSGKSMIARAMMGLLPVAATVSGSIDVNGEQIVGMQDRDWAALRGAAIGMVFQNPGASLNPLLTVGRQIALPLELHYDLTAEDRQARVLAMMRKVGLDESLPGASLNPLLTVGRQIALPLELHYDLTAEDRQARVLAMMRKVGLDESLIGRHPHELSGGQQQRVGIATALITSPRLIIADEPTTALDSMTQRQIVELLVSLVDEAGAAMLFITHDFSSSRSWTRPARRCCSSHTTFRCSRTPRSTATCWTTARLWSRGARGVCSPSRAHRRARAS